MKNVLFGYARVSTKEQNEGRQIELLKTEGIDERYLYIEKRSGKDFNREVYYKMRDNLREGDLLIITSLDRFGRNYDDIMKEWRTITQEIKANIKVLDMPLLDTSSNPQSLDNRFMAELVLQILSYCAEKERRNIKQRQAEGIALAKKEGRMQGRPKIQKPDNWNEVYTDWINKKITAGKAIELTGLTRNIFYKFAAKEQKHKKDKD
jgi:DNA invertase Pin-like site-specific DNA recombinase